MLLRENKSFGDQLCKKSMITLLVQSANLSLVYKPISWTVLIARPRDDTVSAFDAISILYTHLSKGIHNNCRHSTMHARVS